MSVEWLNEWKNDWESCIWSPGFLPPVLTNPIPPAPWPDQNTNSGLWLCSNLWNLQAVSCFWVRSCAGHWAQRDQWQPCSRTASNLESSNIKWASKQNTARSALRWRCVQGTVLVYFFDPGVELALLRKKDSRILVLLPDFWKFILEVLLCSFLTVLISITLTAQNLPLDPFVGVSFPSKCLKKKKKKGSCLLPLFRAKHPKPKSIF